MLYGKVVLISGGAGSIGSEICRQVLGFDIRKLVIFDMNENGLFMLGNELNRKYKGKFETVVGSIKDKVRIDEIMQIYRPQVVFHAAAYKHVPMLEKNPCRPCKTRRQLVRSRQKKEIEGSQYE